MQKAIVTPSQNYQNVLFYITSKPHFSNILCNFSNIYRGMVSKEKYKRQRTQRDTTG